MSKDINPALQEVQMTYEELIEIANKAQRSVIGDLDDLLSATYNGVENLTNDAIRDLMLKLALRAYSFGDIKEKAAFKAALAKTIRDEARAKHVQEAPGTVSARESAATLAISTEIIAEEIYSLTAALFKTKSDEIHRVVDVLKTVLTTRLTEAKLTTIGE